MKVICLEGCHGCGKTKLIKTLAKSGFTVLDEGFMDMPTYTMPPQSFTMESMWVMRWVERLLKIQLEQKPADDAVFFADRSPYSALFYAANGSFLEPSIRTQLRELLELAHIEIFVVYIQVDTSVLWKRVQDRLLREPERKKYHEDSYDWMLKVISFYESKRELWNFTVNNNLDKQNLTETFLALMSSQIHNWHKCLPVDVIKKTAFGAHVESVVTST